MKSDQMEKTLELLTPSSRLNLLLDKIGFKQEGRVTSFHTYLTENLYEFRSLKYATVRSWFHDHVPNAERINQIFLALSKNYQCNFDFDEVRAWWKAGGRSPIYFDDCEFKLTQDQQEKLDMLVTAIVTNVSKESGTFNDLSSTDLILVKLKALDFAHAFLDPNNEELDPGWLDTIVRAELAKEI